MEKGSNRTEAISILDDGDNDFFMIASLKKTIDPIKLLIVLSLPLKSPFNHENKI